ncbi:hypothetical protein B9T65_05730 [Serratia marcescens]|uniref:hypothetical protein n=1 Tax=Serratia marcescens TaxID=615 RepID=UPI0006ED14B8|nr:hypothetical protein [Serratia marcescens]ALL39855.1 hypothetical protein AR325_23895 [Serratia marcescens]PHI52379.1 hypothetical protein B9T65_05730 [Serratia marcescens]UJA53658.1 hypothetical protein L1F17_22295 [Serratia marcescens]
MADTERKNKKINITELKNAFKEGAIPNEQDYGNLIDLAAVGGKVLGATEEDATALHLGDGLKYVDGKLAILPTPAGGVLVNKEGVSVKVDGNALATTERGVALRLHQDSGLAVDDNGLHIKTGAGLKTDKDGVTVALVPKSGLTVEGNKLAVNLSQTSGLAFDEKGALKVNVNTEAKNNYITSTDKGLAITAEGVTKIKEALKEVSLTALERAVRGTDSGAKDNDKANGEVETQISQALVNAYKQRSNGKIRVLPVITVFPHTYEKIDLKKEMQEALKKKPNGIPEDTTFYVFIKGNDDKKLWDSIVTGLTSDGELQLTQKDGGEISVLGLGVSHDKEGPFPVMVGATIKVPMPAASDKSTITLDKGSYLTGETMTCTVTLKDKNGDPVDGMITLIKEHVVVPQHNGVIDKWKEVGKLGEYIGTFEAGAHGNHENAERHKASLQLLGWTEKKESEDYYYYGLPKISITNMPKALFVGQTFNPELSFISNGTGANGSKLTWLWKYPKEHPERKEGKRGDDWRTFAYPTSGKFKKVEGTYDGYSYTPGDDDKGCMVKLEVIPIGTLHPKLLGVPVDGPEINIFAPVPVSPKEVSVNGYTFAHDAGFPTTGFRGAQFTLVLNDGKASDYNWESSAAWVKVTDGVVTFTGQGDGSEVTITGKRKEGGSSYIEYKFKLKKWFTNMGSKTMTWEDAKKACEQN